MTHSANSASIILAIALLVPMASSAQTITTNWMMTAPNIREVGGKFYNVDHSILFSDFDGDCVQITANGVIIHEYKTQGIYRTESYGGISTGNFLSGGTRQIKIGERVIVDKNVFIANYPTNLSDRSTRLIGRAMRIGVTNINGEFIEFYDFGKRHLYPAVSTNLVANGKQ